MNRFDNLSLTDLLEREHEARLEREMLVDEITVRLLAECPIKIGKVYRFMGDSRWHGTEFLICGRRVENFASFNRRANYSVGVHGFRALKGSSAGDGFGIRPHVIRDWRLLDLTTERDGPRAGLVEYAALVDQIKAEGRSGRLAELRAH